MKDKEKQQCVICHKDITSELPKIDIYGNHYCKDCYVEKCKYELMNMRDTILINKKLLESELKYLEEQTQKYARKETAEKIILTELEFIKERLAICKQHRKETYSARVAYDKLKLKLYELAKQFGVEIKE